MKLSERISWLKTRIQDNYYITSDTCRWMGRTPEDRRPIARAFVAKALYNLFTTRIFVSPHYVKPPYDMWFYQKTGYPLRIKTFSRAFTEFARTGLGDKVHAVLVEEHLKKTNS